MYQNQYLIDFVMLYNGILFLIFFFKTKNENMSDAICLDLISWNILKDIKIIN